FQDRIRRGASPCTDSLKSKSGLSSLSPSWRCGRNINGAWRRAQTSSYSKQRSVVAWSFLLNLIRIFVREQRGLSACVQEQHRLAVLENPFADQINHPCRGASGVDRIQQKTFVLGKQMDRFALRFG